MTTASASLPVKRPPTASVAHAIGEAAVAALHEELEAEPKPGLVTPRDRGAHRDMDARTFRASIAALRGYFHAVARAGTEGASLAALRPLALDAEARMLHATGGVNTHRGAIFSLGLLTAAAGRLAAARAPFGPAALRDAVRRGYGAAILRELPAPVASHGAIAGRRHGVGGARAEAAAGFPHLFDVALPALRASLLRGASREAAAVQCLLSAIAVLPDTNLLYRGGAAGLTFARAAAQLFLARGGVHRSGWREHARALHRAFVGRDLSPGGSADLLAAALFVERLGALDPSPAGGAG
ncbi:MULTISPECIES: triphosphoribosyl-dephospho-CoA synthase MdcB [Anaeromyxobacter]|uniref:triphosphoribosyl-dephospho-CoA synthase MdcB n=3 Tax=Anaeromyxobacteraceae TaxID=1524215 RepID=UPI001F565FAF|nr:MULTISPECIES: triphosphoribosyl-dephospho-CoA synthase MdcB [unclassified Anaeromyxobacter]